MAHAVLSASGSKRWLSCPPSARLEQEFPDSSSEAAREGTLAHALAEVLIRSWLRETGFVNTDKRLAKIKASEYYNADMQSYVDNYVDIVVDKINTDKAICLVEEKLNFSKWVRDGFGTGDMVIISDDLLEIVDLKYGKGVPVSAEGNTQMQLYALGAIDQFGAIYDFDKVRMTIFQPRNGGLSTQEMTVKDLLAWGESIKPIAEKAYRGEGEFKAGEHCRFCRAATKCRKLAEYNLEIAKLEFRDEELLSDEEIADVLTRVDDLVRYAEKIKTFALEEALKGKRWLGFKLVEGRSTRKIANSEEAIERLRGAGFSEDAFMKPAELLGVTALEKVVTKKRFNELLGGLIDKPRGKPTLVPNSDKRPEYSDVNMDFDVI